PFHTPCLHDALPICIYVYGGTIKPGHLDGKDLTIVSVFEAVGARAAGRMDLPTFNAVERAACPGAGSCGGMYTANTMSAAIEARSEEHTSELQSREK